MPLTLTKITKNLRLKETKNAIYFGKGRIHYMHSGTENNIPNSSPNNKGFPMSDIVYEVSCYTGPVPPDMLQEVRIIREKFIDNILYNPRDFSRFLEEIYLERGYYLEPKSMATLIRESRGFMHRASPQKVQLLDAQLLARDDIGIVTISNKSLVFRQDSQENYVNFIRESYCLYRLKTENETPLTQDPKKDLVENSPTQDSPVLPEKEDTSTPILCENKNAEVLLEDYKSDSSDAGSGYNTDSEKQLPEKNVSASPVVKEPENTIPPSPQIAETHIPGENSVSIPVHAMPDSSSQVQGIENVGGNSNIKILVLTITAFVLIRVLAWVIKKYTQEEPASCVDQKAQNNDILHSVFEPILPYQEILNKLILCVIPASLSIVFRLRQYYYYKLVILFRGKL